MRAAKAVKQCSVAVLAAMTLISARPAVQPVEWPVYGRTNAALRFAPIAQIDRTNISRLGLAWYHEFDTDRGQEATPIMVGGVLYVSSAWSKVFAFDARTGRQLWSFDPEVPKPTLAKSCCDAINRGVSVANGRVFVATLDGRLIALDAKTGHRLWSTLTVDPSKPYTITGATEVAGDLVLIGNGGAEFGVRGYISAYHVATGQLAWRFYTVPHPDGKPDGQPSDKPLRELAGPTWFGKGWREAGGGGTVWDSMAYDPESGVLYFGVGNGGPYDWNIRSDGKGDNLFLSSIVAVKAATGEYLWHYQTTPGDSWDYTATQHIMLLDAEWRGRPRKLLLQAPKNGFFYVLDRTTGELLSAEPYAEVTWAKGIDPKTGRPIMAPGAHYQDKPFLQSPSGLGAHSWHPMAYSPQSRLVYIPTQVMAQYFARDPAFTYRPGHMNVGIDTRTLAVPDDPAELARMKASVYGELIAWDPFAGTVRWRAKHPFFVNGGVLATAGGLVFQGTGEGTLKAYDATSGATLWSYPTVNGIVAPPISYAIDRRQYVAVMVGYGGPSAMYGTIVPYRPRLPGRLMVFAIDGKAKAKPYDIPQPAPVDLTGVVTSGDPVRGLAAYNDTCLVCHGFSARGRFTADLRRSQIVKDPDSFRAVVLDGAFKDLGMVGFGRYIRPEGAEDIRAYLIQEARKLADRGDPDIWEAPR
ncbi:MULTISPECIES: PQQ-dependent dehydrogenase, methanol/ethanol family [unclassified Sphingomonas]|uniref:PQQ-dependent dehydrogenase, methanol/ethanol family n=1 Tax=unclassified Sphingomonas TaxID=196159 RepID=UPI0006F9641D|nr:MULTISPECIES: PQQ-dependent dehydrogenase, methanol/ethanol family [unclassified Sphingomonas]KQX23559.1 alcohol dehydrogenase [Sphingomonas sp. Root1294]KQY68409.1 alcohol dehydrogenase [Sphingomonas sp. Root50]KRB91312.1 alcohol dehydrogenase [Sphingomonas sp. Root720]